MQQSISRYIVAGVLALCGTANFTFAQEAAPTAEPEPAEVKLTNGSVILGHVVGLDGGTLSIKTAFGVDEIVKVKWSEVSEISTSAAHDFRLTDGSTVKGKIVRTEDGSLVIEGDAIAGSSNVTLANVDAINPPPPEDKGVTLTGSINIGATMTDGNTQTKTAAFNANAVARTDRSRLTLAGAWNYAEASTTGITARNTTASIKYDFFVTERAYIFAGAFFQEDSFQNLNLRTALSAGPGYQLYEKGDFAEDSFFHQLQVYGEAGLAFFNEDFRTGMDNRYVSARWAVRADLPISDRLSLFHRHEGYPGLEDISDLYITTEQGIAFTIWEGFISTLQVNWRWDNTPSPGFERSDTLYLWTLGYQFDL